MIIPVLVLFVCFSILFFCDKQNQSYKRNIPILLLITLLLALIATFRPEDMADRDNYISFWNDWGGERFEVGFTFISDTLRLYTHNEYWFFFVFAIISITLKISAICKITPLIWGSLLMYLSNMFILHDMIQMRCAIASGLLLHAIYYLGINKKVKFFIVTFFAILFHYSAIVILPLVFLNIHRIRKFYFICLILLSYFIGGVLPIETIIGYVPIEGIQSLWMMYDDTVGEDINIFNAIQLGRTCICLFLLFYIDKIFLYNKYAILLVKIYAISISIFVLLSSVPVIAFRVSELYQIVEIVLIPMLIYTIRIPLLIRRMSVEIIAMVFLLMNILYMQHLK